MFIRLSPAQSTGVHGWGSRLKTTLSWRDVEENESIDFDRLMKWEVPPRELKNFSQISGFGFFTPVASPATQCTSPTGPPTPSGTSTETSPTS
jgi:hypothetical protein